MHGVSTPHEMIESWRPFNIEGLAPKMKCPLLVMVGESEYAQLDEKVALGMMRFVNELTCPVAIHEFTYEEGWAAAHCQVGALNPTHAVVFNWLDRTMSDEDRLIKKDSQYDWNILNKYLPHRSSEMNDLEKSIRVTIA
jgi:hypothetical protein